MKKYVLVGTGYRGTFSYLLPLTRDFSDKLELSAVFDSNKKRAMGAIELTKAENVKIYDDFDKMIREEKPDTVIVSSKDSTHDKYIIRAMELGCDVISEKPLTTTPEKFTAIYDTMEKTGKNVTVTFNCRFMPFYVKVKELLKSGVIGEVFSVHLEWLLDTSHGADYFRRWHRNRENSGSLLVHKSTHHFDLVNWFLEQDPVKVNAFGTRRFYGPTRDKRSERCLDCPHKTSCEFYLDLKDNDSFVKLYTDAENVDGYFRDKCVFSEEIDIEDTLSLNVKYDKGALLSYSLTAHSPYEGAKFVFNGSKGRIEANEFTLPTGELVRDIKVYDRYNDVITYNFNNEHMITKNDRDLGMIVHLSSKETHSGADVIMLRRLFAQEVECDPLGQKAGIKDAKMSLAIGFAANLSLAENKAVDVSSLW